MPERYYNEQNRAQTKFKLPSIKELDKNMTEKLLNLQLELARNNLLNFHNSIEGISKLENGNALKLEVDNEEHIFIKVSKEQYIKHRYGELLIDDIDSSPDKQISVSGSALESEQTQELIKPEQFDVDGIPVDAAFQHALNVDKLRYNPDKLNRTTDDYKRLKGQGKRTINTFDIDLAEKNLLDNFLSSAEYYEKMYTYFKSILGEIVTSEWGSVFLIKYDGCERYVYITSPSLAKDTIDSIAFADYGIDKISSETVDKQDS